MPVRDFGLSRHRIATAWSVLISGDRCDVGTVRLYDERLYIAPKSAESAVQEPQPHVHYPGLDTLRSLAILMVIAWHAQGYIHNPPLSGVGRYGWAGVDLFFVLSGCLIGSQLLQMVKRDGRVQFSRFYLKRSLRILPAYWVVILLYMVWPGFSEREPMGAPWRYLFFYANLPMAAKTFSHSWSLCVEEHFYLLFPLAVHGYLRKPRSISPRFVIAVIMLAGAVLRYSLWAASSAEGAVKWNFGKIVYYPTYCRLDGLAVGIGIAMLREYRDGLWAALVSRPWAVLAASLALIYGGMVAFDSEWQMQMTAAVLAFPLVSLGFGGMVVAALSPTFWLSRWRVPGAAALATAAYTIYLTHKQMIVLAVRLIDQPDDHPVLTVELALILVILAAAILHFTVEKPGLRLRDRLLMRSATGIGRMSAPFPENQR